MCWGGDRDRDLFWSEHGYEEFPSLMPGNKRLILQFPEWGLTVKQPCLVCPEASDNFSLRLFMGFYVPLVQVHLFQWWVRYLPFIYNFKSMNERLETQTWPCYHLLVTQQCGLLRHSLSAEIIVSISCSCLFPRGLERSGVVIDQSWYFLDVSLWMNGFMRSFFLQVIFSFSSSSLGILLQ